MANVALKPPTNAEVPSTPSPPDEPFLDMTAYGAGPNGSITGATENAGITITWRPSAAPLQDSRLQSARIRFPSPI